MLLRLFFEGFPHAGHANSPIHRHFYYSNVIRRARYCPFDQVSGINTPKRKKERRIFVEPGTDATERRGYELAHAGPVRTGAVEVDLLWISPRYVS